MLATPSVPPTSRVVSLTAEPAPALARGSAPMIASVAGPVVNARPAAISDIPITTMPQYGASAAVLAATTNPERISARPNAAATFVAARLMTAMEGGGERAG